MFCMESASDGAGLSEFDASSSVIDRFDAS
jgi:hypothetical protein